MQFWVFANKGLQMKIAFITELFHPSIGGQEIRFQELGQELVHRGHQVKIFTIRFDLNSKREEKVGGVDVLRLTDCPTYKSSLLRRNPLGILRFSWDLFRIRKQLQGFDVVIYNIWPILPPIVLNRALRGKAIIDICEIRTSSFWPLIYRRLTALTKIRLLGVNSAIVQYLQQHFAVSESKSHVVLSGVNLMEAGLPPFEKNPKALLFLGRMAAHKNPRLAVEAFLESGLADQGYTLDMAGSGPELETIKADFHHPAIHFHGFIDDDKKWKLLRQSSLLILPSQREGFPRIVAEGACVGTPTLTLDYPENGTASVVREYGVGWVCAPDKQALIEELRAVGNKNWPVATMTGQHLVDVRALFSWDTITSQLLQFIKLERS